MITPAREMREMATGIAGSEFVELPGVGHLSALEAPVEFNTALARFLRRVARRREAGRGSVRMHGQRAAEGFNNSHSSL